MPIEGTEGSPRRAIKNHHGKMDSRLPPDFETPEMSISWEQRGWPVVVAHDAHHEHNGHDGGEGIKLDTIVKSDFQGKGRRKKEKKSR